MYQLYARLEDLDVACGEIVLANIRAMCNVVAMLGVGVVKLNELEFGQYVQRHALLNLPGTTLRVKQV